MRISDWSSDVCSSDLTKARTQTAASQCSTITHRSTAYDPLRVGRDIVGKLAFDDGERRFGRCLDAVEEIPFAKHRRDIGGESWHDSSRSPRTEAYRHRGRGVADVAALQRDRARTGRVHARTPDTNAQTG